MLLTIRSPDLSRAVDTMAVEGRGVQTQAILQYYQGDLWYYTLCSTVLLVLPSQKSIYVQSCNAQHTITCMATVAKAWPWLNGLKSTFPIPELSFCVRGGKGWNDLCVFVCVLLAVSVFLCIIFM